MAKIRKIFSLMMFATLLSGVAIAAEGEDPATGAAAVEKVAPTPVPAKEKKSKGGNYNREKDADGTEAPDRFEANTVIKSQYKLNGEQLEVDPD